jgi:hypothetical protein
MRHEWPANHVNSMDGGPMKPYPLAEPKQPISNTTPLGFAKVCRWLPRMDTRASGRTNGWRQFRQTYQIRASSSVVSSPGSAAPLGSPGPGPSVLSRRAVPPCAAGLVIIGIEWINQWCLEPESNRLGFTLRQPESLYYPCTGNRRGIFVPAWNTLKNADDKGGVRYREHPNRKHGILKDRFNISGATGPKRFP